MILHKDDVNFRESIVRTSVYFKIVPDIIVKDYFVTLFLRTLKTNLPNFIFKGGTSLSKCYKAINRFSEDIDLSYYPINNEKVTQTFEHSMTQPPHYLRLFYHPRLLENFKIWQIVCLKNF